MISSTSKTIVRMAVIAATATSLLAGAAVAGPQGARIRIEPQAQSRPQNSTPNHVARVDVGSSNVRLNTPSNDARQGPMVGVKTPDRNSTASVTAPTPSVPNAPKN